MLPEIDHIRPNLTKVFVNGNLYIFSYSTCIAMRVGKNRFRRDRTFSNTTARHMTETGCKDWPQISDVDFETAATDIARAECA